MKPPPAAITAETATETARLILSQISGTLRGMAMLAEAPARVEPHHTILWQEGGCRLLHYATSMAPPDKTILLIPPMINRWWIMDIHPSRSFAKFLSQSGYQVLVLDWGSERAENEAGFSIGNMITHRLIPAIAAAQKHANNHLHVVGYCMGGVMALAAADMISLAKGTKTGIASLTLLATPWNFHTAEAPPIPLHPPSRQLLENIISREGCLPAWLMQPMFYRRDLWHYARMLQNLSQLPTNSEARAIALATQYWLHHPTTLPAPAARECLFSWFADNLPHQQRWQIDGITITPSRIRIPTLLVNPTEDHIVPPSASAPFCEQIEKSQSIHPPTGHLGLMISRKAPATAWQPMVAWLDSL